MRKTRAAMACLARRHTAATNGGLTEILGVSRAELIGKNDADLFPPEQAAFFQEKDRQTLDRGLVLDIPEEPIETKQGRRWLHTRKVPLLDEQGTPRHLLGISEDITERKQAATALGEAKEKAGQATGTFAGDFPPHPGDTAELITQ